jgi:hypothetical protein
VCVSRRVKSEVALSTPVYTTNHDARTTKHLKACGTTTTPVPSRGVLFNALGGNAIHGTSSQDYVVPEPVPRAARARHISPTAFEPQARGQRREALWERVEAGSGSLGAASSESTEGSGRLRACGC